MIGRLARRLVKPRRPRVLLQSLAIALCTVSAVAILMMTPAGYSLEQRTVDARFAERGTLDAPKDVVVVAIDRTQESYGGTWPISRTLWAQAIDNLSDAGVAGIAIDVPMDWKAFNPTEEQDLAEAIDRSDVPIVIATRTGDGQSRSLDDVVRSIQTSEAGGGLASRFVRQVGSSDAIDADDSGRTLLNYYGPRGTFEHVSFANVAYGLDIGRDLEGKLVIIGPTEGIARDDRNVPIGGRMSSAEVQATAVANLLDGSWLRTPALWMSLVATMTIALLMWALLLVVPLGLSVPGAAGAIVGWGWLAVALFERGLVVPMFAPMLAGTLAFGGITIALAVVAVRERIRVKSLFARYVHADVVQELIDGEDRIELSGEEREITVLFSDIRGFTSMSEHVDPVELVAQLNEYFEAMVDVVAHEHGTVDKFLGDGMMAIFGAPTRKDDHALRACRAATAMLERLDRVNVDRAARGLAPLRIGIGIHTGRAVVGNVGSPPFRVDFTAIGDTVNLAARIEAMTKELDTPIVVSDSTRASVEATTSDDLAFDPLGTVVARGRSEPTGVHAVRARGEQGEQDLPAAAA